MDHTEVETRLQRLERQNHTIFFGLVTCAVVALVALGAAMRALVPVLRVQSALRTVFTSSSGLAVRPESGSKQSASAVSDEPQTPEMGKLLSVVAVTAKDKRLLPKDPEAGRYSAEVELTLVGDNRSERKVRAYQGTLDVDDLLGNRVILISVESQTPVDSHRTQQFKRYFEINQFEDAQTQFAAESFDNLVFKWRPEKIVFTDGTSIEARE
ncbi:MAG: hypothetical protein ACLQBA_05665 [Candidatus Binataceae bacterium]